MKNNLLDTNLVTNFDIISGFFIALMVSYLITPFLKDIAVKLKVLDHPNVKKIHKEPVPLLGGIAIYLAFFMGLVFTVNFNKDIWAIFIAGSMLIIVGLIDDKYGKVYSFPPQLKLLAQIVAALIVVRMGIRVDFITNYYMSMIFTCFWIVGITNAFNLSDNMDGLSAGIAVVSAFFFGILSINDKNIFVAVISFALMGGALGFLKHNFPKAKIFMGDTGSMFLGFALACITVMGTWSTKILTTSLAIPVFILGYPIFDTTLVTILRIKEGRSIFHGGKDHSSHRLVKLGLSKRSAVIVIYCISCFLGLAAVIFTKADTKFNLMLFGFVILGMLILGIRLAFVKADPHEKTD